MLETKHLARGWGFMTDLWNRLISASVPWLRVCFQGATFSEIGTGLALEQTPELCGMNSWAAWKQRYKERGQMAPAVLW